MNFPAQGYGQAPQQGYQPQQGYGGQPGYGQAPQQAPQPITQSVEDFWANNSGGGSGAPSFDFTPATPAIKGTITHMIARQRTDMATKAPKFNKDGVTPQMQLEVTLQTDLRGWQAVKNIPGQTNPQTGQTVPLPPEHDDGKRRIYVWFTLRDAVTEALREAGVQAPTVGGQLAVQVVGTRPNDKGKEPIKVYKAWYQPGSPDAQAFFDQQAAPAPVPAQAPQQQFQNAAPAQQFQQPQPAPAAQPGWGGQPQFQQGPAAAPAPAAAPPAQQAPPGWGPNASQDPPF